ncbi:MAG: type II secretion system protein GspN [Nitrospirae bacterium GWD2_57_9]|nr:MAG: type II secretion system protein GspN [Nitrospirae bacterium GWD2_57_9]
MLDKKILIRRLSFAGYFFAVFLLFLLFLFPFDRVKARIESEVRLRTPLDLSVGRISPRFFNSYVLSDVVLSDRQGKVLFESASVNTSVSLLSLLRGALYVNMKAAAYGGELLVKMQQGSGRQYLMLDANGLDVSSYALLKNSGFKLTGKIGGNLELNNDTGKGRLWIKGITSRELKIKGFSIPDLDFDKGWLEADIKGDRMMIRKLELEGRELKVQITGDMVMRERGIINLTVRLKPSARLAYEQSAVLSFLKNRDADGFYQFTVGGLLSEPLPRL